MADDKNQRGSQDLNRINLNEPYEVKYWTKIFGVSEEELRDAVRRVGNSVDDIAQELTKAA
jgi:hypothetical protein